MAEAITSAPATATTYKAKINAKDRERVHEEVPAEFIPTSCPK
jgi:hypothetical protein